MQLVIPWRRGQAKPWPSIPRINWAHPLARGLVSYNYDTGGGAVIDLVSGGTGAIINGSGQQAVPRPSAFGSGWLYGTASTTDMVNSAFNVQAANLFTNAPFAVAGGWMHVQTPGASGSVFAMNDAALNFGFQIETVSPNYFVIFAGSVSGDERYTTVATFALNKFTTLVGNCTTSTSGNVYVNGVLDGSFSGNPMTVSSSAMQTIFNGSFLNNFTTGGGGAAGFVYFVAQWNRNLSAQEAFMLHQSPYDHLIYPEDEIAATMVGTSAAGFTWSQTADSQLLLPKAHLVREIIRHD